LRWTVWKNTPPKIGQQLQANIYSFSAFTDLSQASGQDLAVLVLKRQRSYFSSGFVVKDKINNNQNRRF
jgi:hypothetical protein